MKAHYRFLTGTLIVLFVLAGFAMTAGCLKQGRLAVEDMNVQADGVTTSAVTLNVSSSLRNTGGAAGDPLDVRLRAFNTESGFLETEQITRVPGIEWGGSRLISQTIVLPRKGSYRLVEAVYLGSTLSGQGEITVKNLEQLTPDTQQSGLVIEDMDFIVRKVTGDSAVIQADIYIANGGRDPSGPVIIEIKAKEMDAHLTADKQEARIENFEPEKIGIGSTTLTVPDHYNYQVQALIWRNGTVVKRAEGIVQLRPGILVSNGSQMLSTKIDTSKFVAEEARMTPSPYTKSPGFEGAFAILALIGIGATAGIVRRRL